MKHYVITLAILVAVTGIHLSFLGAQEEDTSKKDAAMQVFDIPEWVGSYRALGNQESVDDHTKEVLQTSSIFIRNYVSQHGVAGSN